MKPIKTWAGEPVGNCWCSKKGVATFKGHYYCPKHLKQEKYLDEQQDAVNIDDEARAEYSASQNLFV